MIAAIGASPSSTPVPRGLARAASTHAAATPATSASTSSPATKLVTSPTRHAPRSMCGVTPPMLLTSAPTVLSNSQPLAPRNVRT